MISSSVDDFSERGRDFEAADWEAVSGVHGDLPYMVTLCLTLPPSSDTDAMLAALWRHHAADGDGPCDLAPDVRTRLPAASAIIGRGGCVPHAVTLTRRDLVVCAGYGVEGAEGVACVLLAASLAHGARQARRGRARGQYLH